MCTLLLVSLVVPSSNLSMCIYLKLRQITSLNNIYKNITK